MSYFDKAKDMYNMVHTGQFFEAFEKYYAEDVEMIEATGDVRKGKDTSREFEKQFFESVEEVHGGGVNAITANEEEGITMVESWMELTFKEGGRTKMEEVAVQHWEGDQIVKERFYYNAAEM